MLSAMVVIAAALLAQTGPALYGDIPAEVPTFHLSANGQDLGCVALVSGGDWFTGAIEDLPPSFVGVSYVSDTPWLRVAPAKLPRGAELSAEIGAARRERLKREWKANGYVFVQTAAGAEIPVSEADRALAKKAAEDAQRVAKRSAPENVNIGAANAGAAPVATGAAPPSWRGYVGHLIVIVVSLIVGAVVVKVLLLDGDDDWQKI